VVVPVVAAVGPVLATVDVMTGPVRSVAEPIGEALAPVVEPVIGPVTDAGVRAVEPLGLAAAHDRRLGVGSSDPSVAEPADGERARPARPAAVASAAGTASATATATTEAPSEARTQAPLPSSDPASTPVSTPLLPAGAPAQESGAGSGPGSVAILHPSSERPAVAARGVVVVHRTTIASTLLDEPSVSPD
jgi:hypothetical protein